MFCCCSGLGGIICLILVIMWIKGPSDKDIKERTKREVDEFFNQCVKESFDRIMDKS